MKLNPIKWIKMEYILKYLKIFMKLNPIEDTWLNAIEIPSPVTSPETLENF